MGLYDAVNFYIEQCHWQNTPLMDSLFLLVEIRKGWSNSDSKFPIWEKTLYKVGQYRSFIIPNFQAVLLSILQIKKTAIRCCFWMLASFMEVSHLTTWFIVDLCFLNPHWELARSLLDSRNQTNLLLNICSIVLQRQLVSAIVQ